MDQAASWSRYNNDIENTICEGTWAGMIYNYAEWPVSLLYYYQCDGDHCPSRNEMGRALHTLNISEKTLQSKFKCLVSIMQKAAEVNSGEMWCQVGLGSCHSSRSNYNHTQAGTARDTALQQTLLLNRRLGYVHCSVCLKWSITVDLKKMLPLWMVCGEWWNIPTRMVQEVNKNKQT